MSTKHRLPILGRPAGDSSRGETVDSRFRGNDGGARGNDGGARGNDGAEAVDAEPGDGALLQVGELARATGKTVRAIHHYENLGLLQPHKRSKGRYRLYAPDAVARVRWINKLHDLGMTLTEIQQILEHWEDAATGPEAMTRIRAVYRDKLAEVREQIVRMSALERELNASLSYLDTCEHTCDPAELVDACSACTVHHEDEQEPELVAGLYAGQAHSLATPVN